MKDEYGNEIGLDIGSSNEASQTVQHPPQDSFTRIMAATAGPMGKALHECFCILLKKNFILFADKSVNDLNCER